MNGEITALIGVTFLIAGSFILNYRKKNYSLKKYHNAQYTKYHNSQYIKYKDYSHPLYSDKV